MLGTGDRVAHRNESAGFGSGTVLEVNAEKGIALIEWNTHQVERTTDDLKETRVMLISRIYDH